MHQLLRYYFSITALLGIATTSAQQKTIVHINENKTYQTIHNFGASDAWSCQFIGNWPAAKKNAMADWLFSMDTLSNGNPKGIGLSLWRYNLGGGSAEQGDSSGIKDEWRRAALTTGSDKKVTAQNWFLSAAQKRGVKYFLGFYNSPPVSLTKNGKSFATRAQCNIEPSQHKAFAEYTVKAIQAVKKSTGILFDYISPVNEPQWDWSDGGQEGCPYSNPAISALTKTFSKTFLDNKITSKLLIAEAGNLKYLMPGTDKIDKDSQVDDFFNAASELNVGQLPNVVRSIASHSYFSTSPIDTGMAIRAQVKSTIATVKNLDYWQSEYCILGDNAGEINGDKKDTGITAALYLAKVMYEDLAGADATAWQWWTAISGYDYKDGLVYVDKKNTDGNFSDSKMLWAMGNYSRFVRPGMKRIDVNVDSKNLLVSGYKDLGKGTVVLVFVNASNEENVISTTSQLSSKKITTYTTSAAAGLAKNNGNFNDFIVPSKSIVTVVIN